MGIPFKTLSFAEITTFQRFVVETSGGLGVGFLNPGTLEYALNEIQGSFFGEEQCPTLHDKVATLCWRIIKGHVFIDGNKRTGVMAALVLLRMNGASCSATQQELEDMALAVATGNSSIENLAAFFARKG
jgi:death-on-curing protein